MNTRANLHVDRLRNVARIYLLPCLFMTIAPGALAALADNSSVHISANSIKLETVKRRVVYSGNVRLQHKSLVITGSKAVAQGKDTGSGKIKVTGKPVLARFVDAHGDAVRLTSKSLAYDSTTKILLATGDVELQSKQGTLSGQEMSYDMANNLFNLGGDRDAPRVSAILNIRETPADKNKK
jgi:lipopolysaccharide transport protein LptA